MATIEEQATGLVNSVLAECVKQRTALGIQKYGQCLDDNDQDDRAKAIHLVQELLDAVQYALWLGSQYVAITAAELASSLQEAYSLTSEEIMSGGKK